MAKKACNLSNKMPPVAMVTTSPCEGNPKKLWRYGEGNFIGGPVNVPKVYHTHTGERGFSLKRHDCAWTSLFDTTYMSNRREAKVMSMAHECEIYEGGSVLELGYVIPKLLRFFFPKQFATVMYA